MHTKYIRRFIENQPNSFQGTAFEFRKLVKSLLIKPDEKLSWVKLKNGEWIRE